MCRRGNLFRVAALAAIVMAITVPVAAQPTGVLTGTVSDPSGAPVAGATVVILSSAGSAVATARTSSAGEYRGEGLDPGNYRISTSARSGTPSSKTSSAWGRRARSPWGRQRLRALLMPFRST
jgi:hypothetical protein